MDYSCHAMQGGHHVVFSLFQACLSCKISPDRSKQFKEVQLFVNFAGFSIQCGKRYRNAGNKLKKYVMGEKRRHSASKIFWETLRSLEHITM